MINLNFDNKKKQGDVGMGVAIGWFASNGYTVSVPLTDSQDYDLVVDNGTLQKVQVKTTRYQRRYGVYQVSLRTSGGNRSGRDKVKHFDKNSSDLLFVLAENGNKYLIPTIEIVAKAGIDLNSSYNKYIVI